MRIVEVLARRYKNYEWSLDGTPLSEDEYEAGIIWYSKTGKPTWSELVAQYDDVMAEIESEKTAVQAAKQTAYEKLKAIGLTEDELKALIWRK